MSTLAYKTTDRNITSALVSVLTLSTAISILAFGINLVVAICLSVCLIMLFYHRPLFLVLLWIVLLLVTVLGGSYLNQLGFGSLDEATGYYFLPMDVAYFFTAIHLMINAVFRRDQVVSVIKENPFLSIFLFLIAVYIALYTPVYGKSAIGEARKFYFFFLFPLLTMLSIKEPRDLRRLTLAVFVVAACISVMGFVGLLMGKGEGGYRTIPASGSLIVMFAALSIMVLYMNRVVVMNRIISAGMLGLFLSIVIITYHRSVWLAGGFGLLLLFGLHREKSVFFGKAVVASILVLGVLAITIITIPKFSSTIQGAARGMIDPYSDTTASWRMRMWEHELNRILETKPLFGEGLGGYYTWDAAGKPQMGLSPHNAYVQMILKFGLIGLTVYGLVVYEFFRKTLYVRKTLPQGPRRAYLEMGILNFGAAHAYMMAYGIDLIVLIFFAVGMSAVRLHRDSWIVPRVA